MSRKHAFLGAGSISIAINYATTIVIDDYRYSWFPEKCSLS